MSPGPRSGARRERRALTHAGGTTRRQGDAGVAAILTAAARPPREADPRALTHGFHAWPARMHPHTARALIAASPPGPIADPFMGGGTVVVEGVLAGRRAFGGDVNPVALEVAWARTRAWPAARRAELVEAAEAFVTEARELRARRPVPRAVRAAEGEWFDPPALAEVWSLAAALAAAPRDPITRMLRACLSSILVKASRQVSDSVPRVDEEHRWIPRGRVERWFVARAREHAERLAAFRAQLPPEAVEPTLWRGDARSPHGAARGLAAVVSSPPYPGVYDYAAHHNRRYAILGLDPADARRAEVGARRDVRRRGVRAAVDRYVADMTDVLAAWAGRLADGGRVWLVVGDGQSPKAPIPVLPLIERAARGAGLRITAAVSQARPVFAPRPERARAHARAQARKEEHFIALDRA